MSKRSVFCIFALTLSWQAHADGPANSKIVIDQIYSKQLLPIDTVREGFVTPAFKFFEKGKFVGLVSGAPPSNVAFATALHSVPTGFSGKDLKDELAAVHLAASTDGKTVVAYVLSGYCPPCEQIVSNVKGRLAGAGWSNARFLVTQIVMN